MLNFLPSYIIFLLFSILIFINSFLTFLCLLPFILIKIIFSNALFLKKITAFLPVLGKTWARVNNFLIDLFCKTNIIIKSDIDINNINNFSNYKNYLLICNHQSWVDIFIIEKVFVNKIPLTRFFIKKNLIWLPFVGLACWALDFPFMKRYSKEYLKKHPSKQQADLNATKNFCNKICSSSTTITNFIEGTRFNKAKHKKQHSPYKYLLKPKAGGIAYVISEMGENLDSIINVTICYPKQIPSTIDLFSGKLKDVIVIIEKIPIPLSLANDFFKNQNAQKNFYNWINELWQKKDNLIKKFYTSFHCLK